MIWLIAPLVLSYVALLVTTESIRLSQIVFPVFIGIFVDLVLTLTGVFQFSSNSPLLPFWLVILWIAFATTLTQSLSFLGKNVFAACLFGAIGFPLNYSVGERLGAVAFGESYLITLILLCLLWAILLPVMSHVSKVREVVICESA